MRTTLIISCKNESLSLASVITKAKPYVDELLVIDGHSKDHSRDIARKHGATVYLDNGSGKGAGLQLGIKKATGDILVFMDADGSHIASDIPKLIRPLQTNKAEFVIASRIKGGSDDYHGTLEDTIHVLGSALVTQLINWRWQTHITDSQNGFRAIKTSVARTLDITENSFAIEQDMLMKALANHVMITEVPSHELPRVYGKSKIDLWSMWIRYIANVLYNCFRTS